MTCTCSLLSGVFMKFINGIAFTVVVIYQTLSLAQTSRFMCRLSIANGHGMNYCNAVYIGNNKILSAAHCFPDGDRTLDTSVILANCGGKEITTYKRLTTSWTKSPGTREDFALLETTDDLKMESIAPTKYPSTYFDLDQLNSTTQCIAVFLRNDFYKPTLYRFTYKSAVQINIKTNSKNEDDRLAVTMKNGGLYPKSSSLMHGDSGGALICKAKYNSHFELVGIIQGLESNSRGELTSNIFSPVFGPVAKSILAM